MPGRKTPLALPIALLGAVSGARSMSGIAVVARARAAESAPTTVGRRLDADIATATAALALFELMADKAPHIPDRIDPGPLFGRVAAGAVVGASVAQMAGRNRRNAAIGGALAAFVGAHISFRLRQRLAREMPPFVAALVEDVVVSAVAIAGAATVSRLLAQPRIRSPRAAAPAGRLAAVSAAIRAK